MGKVIGGALAIVLLLPLLLGWLVALLWNHFEFLEAIQHLSWWGGTLLMVLCNILFKATITSK